MTKARKSKPALAWGGVCNGRLDIIDVDAGWGGFGTGDIVRVPALFTSWAKAKEKYQTVIRVEIRPAPKKRK